MHVALQATSAHLVKTAAKVEESEHEFDGDHDRGGKRGYN
jgi:hypothetical protein